MNGSTRLDERKSSLKPALASSRPNWGLIHTSNGAGENSGDIIDVDALADEDVQYSRLPRSGAIQSAPVSVPSAEYPASSNSNTAFSSHSLVAPSTSAMAVSTQMVVAEKLTSAVTAGVTVGISTTSTQVQKRKARKSALTKEDKHSKQKKPTLKELLIRAKEQKSREEKMKLSEYIEILPEKLHDREQKHSQFLAGTVILFARKMTETHPYLKKKLDMLYQHGATLVSAFDPAHVTHIVTAGTKAESIIQINEWIGTLVPVSQVPLRIRILDWAWVLDCGNYNRIVEPTQRRYIHDGRWKMERRLQGTVVETPVPKKRKREYVALSSEDEDDREKPTKRKSSQESAMAPKSTLPSPPSEGSPKSTVDNPLAEFNGAGPSDDDQSEVERQMARWKSFRCMQRGRLTKGVCPNQDVIDKLQKLYAVHAGRPGPDEEWKAYNTMKAIGIVRRYPTRFKSLEEAIAIKGIGKKTGLKIMEIINTGGLKRLEYERTEQTVVSEIFQDIYGVGPQLATRWFSLGLRTLEDVAQEKFGIKLTAAQRIGVKYYEDLGQRMPREEAKAIYDRVAETALSLDPKLLLELMGSYRRGRETCGDIDILITRNTKDGVDHRGILPRLLNKLRSSGIIIADLGGEMGEDLEAKYMGICRLSPTGVARRIDILCIPYEQWGGALVYFTGDDMFNRSMRLLANKKGMSLNQRGLWAGVVRDPKSRIKTCVGTLIASRTEKDIFAALGVPWQLPHERILS